MFNRLKAFKLRINCNKLCFVRPIINYLGHVITTNCIYVNPDNISAAANRLTPTKFKKLQSVIPMFFWYRKFILNFPEMSHHLTNLLKKKAVRKCGQKHQLAFDELKDY